MIEESELDALLASLSNVLMGKSKTALSRASAFGVQTKVGYVEAGKSEAFEQAAQIVLETFKSSAVG